MTGRQRRALLKPFELLAIAAGLALFAGIVAGVATRNPTLALIGAGIVFIVALVVLAMLVLSYRPNPEATVYLDRFDERTPPADDAGTPSPDADDPLAGPTPDGAPRA